MGQGLGAAFWRGSTLLERLASCRDVLVCGIPLVVLLIPTLWMFKSELVPLDFLHTQRTQVGMYFWDVDLFVLL